MVIKQVPGWARKCIVIGILLPMACFFFLKDYNHNFGFFKNVMIQDVQIPFLWGQNPVQCMQEGFQRILKESLGFGQAIHTQGCQRNTLVPYRFISLLSLFMVILGVYMFARGDQLANLWPTEWKVFDEKNVRKKGRGQLLLEDPQDKPINPKDGGF